MSEYDDVRFAFRPITTSFLNRLRETFKPLEDRFEVIYGDICCGSCAGYEAAAATDESGKPYYLYWTIQDEETLDTYGEDIYIGFSGNSDKESVDAANLIIDSAKAAGFTCEWDGSTSHRIKILAGLGPNPTPRGWEEDEDGYDC